MTTENVNPKRELLFHYTKFDTALNYILPKMQLKLNPIGLTNDIYEIDINLDDCIEDVYQRITSRVDFEYFKNKRLKLLCTVHDSLDVRGFDNQMMWSFYGEGYKGICLILDRQVLVPEFDNMTQDKGKHNPIKYEFKRPKKNDGDELSKGFSIDDLNKNRVAEVFDDASQKYWDLLNKNDRLNDIFFRKNEQWEKENEYRFINYDDREPDFFTKRIPSSYLSISKSLVGIIIGPKFDFNRDAFKVECLKHLMTRNNFKIYKSKYEKKRIIPLRLNVPKIDEKLDYYKAFLSEENS